MPLINEVEIDESLKGTEGESVFRTKARKLINRRDEDNEKEDASDGKGGTKEKRGDSRVTFTAKGMQSGRI